MAQEVDPEGGSRGLAGEPADPLAELRSERCANARLFLRAIDPSNRALETLSAPDYPPSEGDIQKVEAAAEAAAIQRVHDFVLPDGKPIGQPGTKPTIREMLGGLSGAQKAFDYLSAGGTPVPFSKGSMVRLPGNAGFVVLRPVTSSLDSPAVDINVLGMSPTKLHY